MSPHQCRAARALLGLSRPQLSQVAHVGKNTIQAFETGMHRPNRATISKLRAAFTSLSVRFTEDVHGIGIHRNFTLTEIEQREEFVDRPRTEPPLVVARDPRLPITPGQARAARAFLDMSQARAASLAEVGLSLLVAFETGIRLPRTSNLLKIKEMYEARGIVFTEINGVPAVQASSSEPRAETTATEEESQRWSL